MIMFYINAMLGSKNNAQRVRVFNASKRCRILTKGERIVLLDFLNLDWG